MEYADGKSVKLTYNPLKQLTEIKDWLGATTIKVDEHGRALSVTDHNGKQVGYTFGPGGERTGIKYPCGKTVEYRYDEALRLKTLIDGDNTVEYAYDENSRLSGKVFSSGASTKYTYNGMGMLSGLTHSDNDGILDKYVYTYDSMLNKTGVEKYRRGLEEESGKYQYTYDGLSRLTGVIKDDGVIKTYGYDGFGNRSYMTDQNGETRYRYNTLNQLLRIGGSQKTQEFSYDARGNLTQVFESGKLKNSYEYSPLNRLAKAVNASGQSAGYEYNGLGFRVGKQINDGINPARNINYLIDQTKQYHNLLQMGDGAQANSYTWDNNAAFADGNTYLQDEMGSPLRYLDATGALIDSYGYDEFGNDLYGNQGENQPFGFTGYTADLITGMYYAQAREYMPSAGRFAGVDIVKGHAVAPATLNPYTYCWNNPLCFVDLNGMEPVEPEVGPVAPPYWLQFIEQGNDAHRTLNASLGVAQTPGLRPNVYISSGLQTVFDLPYGTMTGRGQADFVLFWGNAAEVYELKPDTFYGNKVGPNQVEAYARALDRNDQYPQVTFSVGSTWQSAFNITLPSLAVPGRTITYWQDPPRQDTGLVYYRVNHPPRRQELDVSHVSSKVPESAPERDLVRDAFIAVMGITVLTSFVPGIGWVDEPIGLAAAGLYIAFYGLDDFNSIVSGLGFDGDCDESVEERSRRRGGRGRGGGSGGGGRGRGR